MHFLGLTGYFRRWVCSKGTTLDCPTKERCVYYAWITTAIAAFEALKVAITQVRVLGPMLQVKG